MPSGVGAHLTLVRAVISVVIVAAGVSVFAAQAGAQAAPGGIAIDKVEIGGTAPATFEVTGPGITGTTTLQADVLAENTPTPALPALPPLTPGTYTITETAPADENGQSVWELTSVVCGGQQMQVQGNSVQVDVADTVIACTFTDTVTRAAILGQKIVTGDTSTWTRPAQFHITCPALELDIDIEPPVGPGGPGTYIIGQGSIPPATCTISEIDTGSDSNVQVSMVIANHGVPIASGTTAVTFTSHAGDDLVLTVRNTFFGLARPELPEQATTSTTIAGGSTTTTTAASTTTTLVVVQTLPVFPPETPPTTAPTSSAPTTAPSLPTTGSPTGGLLVAALVAMLAGLALVARTRRFVD